MMSVTLVGVVGFLMFVAEIFDLGDCLFELIDSACTLEILNNLLR
jgi:hypothetical protein